MRQLVVLGIYGLWCLGEIAEPATSGLGIAVQIVATILIAVIGYLLKAGLDDMKSDIHDQGKRLRHVELDVRQIASEQGVRLPKNRDDDE